MAKHGKSGNRFEFSGQVLTVKALREYLEALEEVWTEEDEKYLGRFEDQKINCIHYTPTGDKGVYRIAGIGPATIYYDGGLDFIVTEADIPRARKR